MVHASKTAVVYKIVNSVLIIKIFASFVNLDMFNLDSWVQNVNLSSQMIINVKWGAVLYARALHPARYAMNYIL